MHNHMRCPVYALVLLFCSVASSQNLVPNPSFEILSDCPDAQDQVFKAIGWNAAYGTPDLLNICATGQVALPLNHFGYQWPASGEGVVHMISYSDGQTTDLDWREWVFCELSYPLSIGTLYHASFKVSWTSPEPQHGKFANDHLGLLLKTAPWQIDYSQPIPNEATIWSNQIVTDSVGWITLSGYFIADSAYTHLYLGHFFDNSMTAIQDMNQGALIHMSYYYFDDVCISTDSLDCAIGTGLFTPIGTDVRVYPNPCLDKVILDLPKGRSMSHFAILDATGRTLPIMPAPDSRGTLTLSTEILPPGHYTLGIQLDDGTRSAARIIRLPESKEVLGFLPTWHKCRRECPVQLSDLWVTSP